MTFQLPLISYNLKKTYCQHMRPHTSPKKKIKNPNTITLYANAIPVTFATSIARINESIDIKRGRCALGT